MRTASWGREAVGAIPPKVGRHARIERRPRSRCREGRRPRRQGGQTPRYSLQSAWRSSHHVGSPSRDRESAREHNPVPGGAASGDPLERASYLDVAQAVEVVGARARSQQRRLGARVRPRGFSSASSASSHAADPAGVANAFTTAVLSFPSTSGPVMPRPPVAWRLDSAVPIPFNPTKCVAEHRNPFGQSSSDISVSVLCDRRSPVPTDSRSGFLGEHDHVVARGRRGRRLHRHLHRYRRGGRPAVATRAPRRTSSNPPVAEPGVVALRRVPRFAVHRREVDQPGRVVVRPHQDRQLLDVHLPAQLALDGGQRVGVPLSATSPPTRAACGNRCGWSSRASPRGGRRDSPSADHGLPRRGDATRLPSAEGSRFPAARRR